MTYVELPYMEDVREYEFAPIHTERIRPSNEQLDAMDDLVESMKLSTDESDDAGAQLDTVNMHNPVNQHLYRCLAHRATRPGVVLPEVGEDLASIMAPLEDVAERADSALDRVAQLFPREEVEAKKAKVTGDALFAAKKYVPRGIV